MAKILKFLQTIRNNWKKSVVGAAAFSYGVSYSKDAFETDQLMRQYCETASRYGDAPCPTNIKHRRVTVILNPNAKNGKAKKLFTKYCEPLLHLAGIAVTVIQTKSENEARKIVMDLDTPTDAIIVAGGDGTLSDVLTGLVRKCNSNINSVKQCPIGILPLGQVNRVAKSMYGEYDSLNRESDRLSDVRQLAEATMAVIRENSKMMDMIEVEPIEENAEEPVKPIYAMGMIEWGAWKDAHTIAKKYWYWGPLKKYATYIFNGYKEQLNWNCDATIKYTNPCDGCSRCHQSVILTTNKRWWHAFVPKRPSTPVIDYSKIVNEQCGVPHELPISTNELHIESSNVEKSEISSSPPSLKLKIGPRDIGYFNFVLEGWKQENDNKLLYKQVLEAKDIEIIPEEVSKEKTLYIDDEEYELKSVKIKLLSRAVKVFTPELNS
ncbi:acylglycerol kinase-like protein Mulk [Halictus rubicundus]|uniref:acylglycerol kinase-like protein Mulk n=1 Tax=Halictus rubicundus TaxID=77578 RepID=UPI004036A78B